MSVSSVTSALSSTSSLAALLSSNTAASSDSAVTVAASPTGDAVTVDLSDIAKAAASGDTSTQAAAVTQLKADLATEQSALLGSLTNSGSAAPDVGDSLLSTIYGSSSLASLSSQSNGTTGTTINTTA